MAYGFKNLIFEGGGVKGIAYVGAMEELEQRGVLNGITRVGGTSAGAINAVTTALGYTNAEVRDILWDLDFNNFMDDSWGVVRDTSRLINEFGWYKGDFFRQWIGNLIAEKTGNPHSTFKELADHPDFRDLYVCVTNISTKFTEVFSPEHTPRVRVADAVRMSMSIPLFFAAVRNVRGDVLVDGGVLRNYPVKLFDRSKYISDDDQRAFARETDYYRPATEDVRSRNATSSAYVYNRQTLGFRLDSAREIAVFRDGAEPPRENIDDFFDFAWQLFSTLMEAESNAHLHGDDWQRTVYIDSLGVGTTDFDLKDEQKEALVASGRQGASDYFAWFDDPDAAPVNRPVAIVDADSDP